MKVSLFRLVLSRSDQLERLVVSFLPDEWLSHSVISWLSASLAFIMPSGWADWNAFAGGESLELDSTDFGELVSSLLALETGGLALILGGEDLGGLLLRLDAVVVILLVSIWASHGAVATSDSHEEVITLGLESGWGDLFAGVFSVRSLTSGLWTFEVELTFVDLLLDGLWEVIVEGEEGLDIIVCLYGETVDGEDFLNASIFWVLGEGTYNE
jgi:hypothetical protein